LKVWTQDISISGNLDVSSTVTGAGFNSHLQTTGTFSLGGSYTVTQNFYNRSFFGTPNCSGVSDGWTGVDTSGTGNLWICISGVARHAALI
jgi:hypothetical protein